MKRNEILAQFNLYNYIYGKIPGHNTIGICLAPVIVKDCFVCRDIFTLETTSYPFENYGKTWAFRPEDISEVYNNE